MPFPDLPDRLLEVRDRIEAAVRRGGHGQQVTIVAVTKTHGPDAVQSAWEAGLADVGENRVQEALPKMDLVSAPVRWHLIGHLQRNKVKYLPRFDLLHALDSARLADAVNELGLGSGRPVSALLQVNVVGEESKGGIGLTDVAAEAEHLSKLEGIRVRGVMTMALSMGMSNDFEVAVEEGATHVRLGTILFGARPA
jgi:hypothetical protein